jgi:hypothetical protein
MPELSRALSRGQESKLEEGRSSKQDAWETSHQVDERILDMLGYMECEKEENGL